MKRIIFALVVLLIPFISFARTVNEIKQILVGEWVDTDNKKSGYTVFSSDGTLSEMVLYGFFVDELLKYKWDVTESEYIQFAKPDKRWKERLNVIDNNTITISGTKYVRRGSNKSSSKAVSPKATSGHYDSSTAATPATKSPLILVNGITTVVGLRQLYHHPLNYPADITESTAKDFIAFCREREYKFSQSNISGKLRSVFVENAFAQIFGVVFFPTVHESSNFVYEDGEHVKMSVTWKSEKYVSLEKYYDRFIEGVIRSDGVLQEENDGKRKYVFPDGTAIRVNLTKTNITLSILVKN